MPHLFEKTKINKDFARLNRLIYGLPKTGKSSFAACQVDKEGREPLFISTEDGLGALEAYSVRVTSWDGVKKLLGVLKDNATQIQKDHSCFVIDLISDCDLWCAEWVAKKNNVAHLADMQFGKGWALAKAEFQSVIRALFEILPVTFICHSAEKDIFWNAEVIKMQAPSLSKGALEFVNAKVDTICYMIPANSKRAMPEITMKPSLMSIAGSRYRQIAKSFPINPNDPAATFKEIAKVFANEKNVVIEEKETAKNPVTSSSDSAQVATN